MQKSWKNCTVKSHTYLPPRFYSYHSTILVLLSNLLYYSSTHHIFFKKMNFKVNLRHQYTSSLNTPACITLTRVQYSFDYFFEVKGGASGKEPTCQCRRHKRSRFNLWVGTIPWRWAWQLTPVFLLGESTVDRGAWQATVRGVTKSWTWLKWLHACTHA